jgi:hypothetical protein
MRTVLETNIRTHLSAWIWSSVMQPYTQISILHDRQRILKAIDMPEICRSAEQGLISKQKARSSASNLSRITHDPENI